PPVAVADTNTIAEEADSPATGNVLANDTDVDQNDQQVLKVSAVNDSDTAVGATIEGKYGTLTLNENGSDRHTRARTKGEGARGFGVGQSADAVFDYTVSDGHGGSSSSTLTITVTGTNAPPVAVADTNAVKEDTAPNPVTGNVLTNDTDADQGDQQALVVSAV